MDFIKECCDFPVVQKKSIIKAKRISLKKVMEFFKICGSCKYRLNHGIPAGMMEILHDMIHFVKIYKFDRARWQLEEIIFNVLN